MNVSDPHGAAAQLSAAAAPFSSPGEPMTFAVFYLDAKVLAQPLTSPAWCSEFADAMSRARTLFPLEVVVVTPAHLAPTPRRYIDLVGADDVIGATRATATALSAAVTLDANVRVLRGGNQGWLLTDVADKNRLRHANFSIRTLAFGMRVAPPLVSDLDEVLYAYARTVEW